MLPGNRDRTMMVSAASPEPMRVSITNFLTASFLSSGRLPGSVPAHAIQLPASLGDITAKIPAPRPRQCTGDLSNDTDRGSAARIGSWSRLWRLSELGARTPSWKRHGSRCGRHQRLLLGDRGSGCCSSLWSVACGTPVIGPAGGSAAAMLVRAASNDAVAAFGASGTIAASHGTSRSIALLTNTLDETRDTRQRDMARSLAFERRQRC